MAQIPYSGVIDQTVQSTPMPYQDEQRPYVYEAAFGKGVGESLEKDGSMFDQIAQADGKAQAANLAAGLSTGISKQTIANQQTAAPDGSGYADQQANTYDSLYKGAIASLGNNPNPYAVQALQEHAATQRPMVIDQAQQWQATQQIANRKMNIETSGLQNANNLAQFSNPQQADQALPTVNASAGSVIDSSLLPPELRGQMKQKQQTDNALAVATSWTDKDPSGFLKATTPQSQPADSGMITSAPLAPIAAGNNNPGNLRGDDAWQGRVGTDANGFVQFDTPENGKRALQINLQNQQNVHGLNTVQDIIGKYAPPGDNNNTAAYIKNVSAGMGVAPDAKIDLNNQSTLDKMTAAVTKQEGNSTASAPPSDDTTMLSASPAPTTPAAPLPNFMQYLTPEQMHTLNNRALENQNRGQKVAQAGWYTDQKNAESMSQNGVVNAGANLTLERAEQLWPGQGQQYVDDAKLSIQAGYDMHNSIVQTPAQMAAALKQQEPVPGDENYAVQDQQHSNLELAQFKAQKLQQTDPMGTIGIAGGLSKVQKFTWNDPVQMAQEVTQRSIEAQQFSKDYGVPVAPLSKAEAKQFGTILDGQSSIKNTQLLQSISDGASNPQAMRAIMAQIAPAKPTYAVAGTFLNMPPIAGTADTGQVPASIVGGQIAYGTSLLYPTKGDKAEEGSFKQFNMPEDNAKNDQKDSFQSVWDTITGDNTNSGVFRNNNQSGALLFQAARANYATIASAKGINSGKLDSGIANQAINQTLGTVSIVNGAKVLAPYGMRDSDFQDRLKAGYTTATTGNPLATKYSSAVFQNDPDNEGVYHIRNGDKYLTDKDGMPVTVNVLAAPPNNHMQIATPDNNDVIDQLNQGGAL